MRLTRTSSALAIAATAAGLAAVPAASAAERSGERVTVREFKLPSGKLDVLHQRWANRILARHDEGTWAPMRMELTDRDLKLMGLPSKKVLTSKRSKRPTIFYPGGRTKSVAPGLIAFAGTGYFGIRPGAWLLFINGNSVGWCSAAHVYGSPGSYDISTAGHCGNTGDIVSVVGLVGDRLPVVIDFGRYAQGIDGGVGKDWALIDVFPQYQALVSPTMAFWGGPRGVYTKTGDLAAITMSGNGRLGYSVNPDPLLAQGILHYGHGTGIGAGGTPRAGTAISWRATHFMWFGAITPGDSGSGSNTLGGDTVGAANEAAGINTHIYVDPLMRQGLGIMASTRVTSVGTPANGQLVGYPYPAPILP